MMNIYDKYEGVIVVIGLILWNFACLALSDWLF